MTTAYYSRGPEDELALAQGSIDRVVDSMKPFARLKFYFIQSSDNTLYLLGLVGGGVTLGTTDFSKLSMLTTPAYAQSGLLSQGQNFIALLIFIAFIVALLCAVFAHGAGRKAAETFAKLLAGGLCGFVGGTKA